MPSNQRGNTSPQIATSGWGTFDGRIIEAHGRARDTSLRFTVVVVIIAWQAGAAEESDRKEKAFRDVDRASSSSGFVPSPQSLKATELGRGQYLHTPASPSIIGRRRLGASPSIEAQARIPLPPRAPLQRWTLDPGFGALVLRSVESNITASPPPTVPPAPAHLSPLGPCWHRTTRRTLTTARGPLVTTLATAAAIASCSAFAVMPDRGD